MACAEARSEASCLGTSSQDTTDIKG
jgi:hypothetical protein